MARNIDPDDEEQTPQQGRGRSVRKREIADLHQLAQELLTLSDARCAGLPVTEGMKNALAEARATKARVARKRSLKYLVGLLRDSELETQSIRNYLAGAAYTVVTGDESSRDLEVLRSGLASADSFENSLERIYEHFPHIDIVLVTRLARALHLGHDDKAHRALFRELRRAADESELDG